MSVLVWCIGVLVALVWLLTIVDIARRHLGAKATAAWVLLVLILPLIGSVLYWALERPARRDAAEEAAIEHGLEEYRPTRPPADTSRFG